MNEKIKTLLEELYSKYKTLDPFILIERIGIELRYVNYLDNPSGQYQKLLGDPIILLSESLENDPKKYYIAAHELYHSLEHSDLISYYILNSRSRAKIETEANKFAAALCFNLYIEEHGIEYFTKIDLERNYGVPMEYSDLYL